MHFSTPVFATLLAITQASPLAAPVPEVMSGVEVRTTDLAKRGDAGAGIVIFEGICQGTAPNFGAAVSGTEVKTGCIQLDKLRKSYVLSGNYWGWKVYSDPYCLNQVTATNVGFCYQIAGNGGWSISYGA